MAFISALQSISLGEFSLFWFAIGFVFILIIFILINLIYNAYLHPLASFPGPKLYGASNIPTFYHGVLGDFPRLWAKMHDKYGPVVRVGVSELSFISPRALDDIYGSRTGQPQLDKIGTASSGKGKQVMNIVDADLKTHARQRRIMSYAFSDAALQEQESTIMRYIDTLMYRFHDKAASNDPIVNVSAWFNYATLDVLGDLAYGESFDCLANSRPHPWLRANISSHKIMVWVNICNRITPWLSWVVFALAPKHVVKENTEALRMSQETTFKRLAAKTERRDIISYLLRHSKDGQGPTMSAEEIQGNSTLLISAGSETTATICTGTTFFLLRHPQTLAKLTQEIRSTFQDESQITRVAVAKLPYLAAVVNESFRLYPPVDGATNRITPPGGRIIDGHFVPEGVRVGVPQAPAYWSRRNFRDPELFVPERWKSDNGEYATDNKQVLQPFGLGPRNCLGRNIAWVELRLILTKLLWNFDLELLPGQDDWAKQKQFILWERGPLLVRLQSARELN